MAVTWWRNEEYSRSGTSGAYHRSAVNFSGAWVDHQFATLRWSSSGAIPGYYRVYDARNSVTHLVSTDDITVPTHAYQNIVEAYRYDAFGKPTVVDAATGGDLSPSTSLSLSAKGNRYLFTGREWLHGVALYDYRTRHYHTEIGRFLQTDTIGFAGGDQNLYRYCSNSPANYIDPAGTWGWLGRAIASLFRYVSEGIGGGGANGDQQSEGPRVVVTGRSVGDGETTGNGQWYGGTPLQVPFYMIPPPSASSASASTQSVSRSPNQESGSGGGSGTGPSGPPGVNPRDVGLGAMFALPNLLSYSSYVRIGSPFGIPGASWFGGKPGLLMYQEAMQAMVQGRGTSQFGSLLARVNSVAAHTFWRGFASLGGSSLTIFGQWGWAGPGATLPSAVAWGGGVAIAAAGGAFIGYNAGGYQFSNGNTVSDYYIRYAPGIGAVTTSLEALGVIQGY